MKAESPLALTCCHLTGSLVIILNFFQMNSLSSKTSGLASATHAFIQQVQTDGLLWALTFRYQNSSCKPGDNSNSMLESPALQQIVFNPGISMSSSGNSHKLLNLQVSVLSCVIGVNNDTYLAG